MNVSSKWIENWLLNFASSNFQVIERSFTSIEHNLDVVRCSDWIIDLGPEGGDKGGEILVTGTPEEVAQHSTSHTGQYLARVLEQHPPEIPVIAA